MKIFTQTSVYLLFSLFLAGSCKQSVEEATHTEASNGTQFSGYALPDIDHGTLQSPVNILTQASEGEQHQISFRFDGTIDKVENLGHTVQLDLRPGTLTVLDTVTYEFKQLHFHTPGEHLIDGMTFPMEMHMVNTLKYPEHNTKAPQYLVIGVLFKMGNPNRFIEEFISLIPNHEHETTDAHDHKIHLPDLFQHPVVPENTHFYHYEGSLTTPPYTESVSWFVLQEVQEASPEEIEKINQIEGNNARHIQALFGRHIFNQ